MSTLATVFGYGVVASRPAAAVAGRFYYATDTTLMYRDNGSTWDTLAVGTGSMATDGLWDAAGDLAVGTGANTGAKLVLGTSGYVLASNGTTVAYAVAPKAHWCRITDGNAQSINDDTLTAITSNDAEVADADNWHDTGTNTSRILPTFAGLYSFVGEVFFTANATGLREVQLYKNGTTQIALHRSPVANGTNATEIQAVCHAVMNGSTDYVEVRARQTSTAAMNVFLSMFEAVLIGTTP